MTMIYFSSFFISTYQYFNLMSFYCYTEPKFSTFLKKVISKLFPILFSFSVDLQGFVLEKSVIQ